MDHKTHCRVDSLLTTAGVAVYKAHEALAYNDFGAMHKNLVEAVKSICDTQSLLGDDFDTTLAAIRGLPIHRAIEQLPVSKRCKQALVAAVAAPRPTDGSSSYREKIEEVHNAVKGASCEGRY